MKIKQIFSILIIIVVLGLAGFFMYKTFFGPTKNTDSKTTVNSSATKAPASGVETILPHGTKLNFENVKKFNPDKHLFPYAEVKPEETGLELNQIISVGQ
jgi:ABC-type transport system involved in Fe-S cluster assembly fused permease/ATPase subunit